MAENQGFFPAQASTVRKGGYMIIRERPCKVIDLSTSKTGKHGHAKINFVATDIFTEKKMEDICQSTHNVNVPEVTKTEYQLLNIDDEGFLSLLDEESGETIEDQRLRDKKLDKELENAFNDGKYLMVIIIRSMGESAVADFKECKQ